MFEVLAGGFVIGILLVFFDSRPVRRAMRNFKRFVATIGSPK